MSGHQVGVYDYDDPRGEIDTPEFLNEQIAKGGARHAPSPLPPLRAAHPLQAVADGVPLRPRPAGTRTHTNPDHLVPTSASKGSVLPIATRYSQGRPR